MASQREQLCCSICQDLLKEPVTATCGHSYCKICIKTHWDIQEKTGLYSCPQCRHVFIPRPVLGKNTTLAGLVEELKKTELQADPEAEKAKSRQNIQQSIQEKGKDIMLLQQELEAINVSADKAVEHSERVFFELYQLMERGHAEVEQQVRSQQETEVSRVKELQGKLEQEIIELQWKDAELQKLSHTQDHNQFLQDYPSLSALSPSTHSSSINIRPLTHFQDVTAAVTEIRDKLLNVLKEEWTNITQAVTDVDVLLPHPEPTTRAEFLKYSRDITLDPNTANQLLSLSEGNRKVTYPKLESCPDHPDRFINCYQVLSKESLTGRCYWEVEWKGEIDIAVSYENICRTEYSTGSGFGRNDKSCVLYCNNDGYTFWMNKVETPVPGPWSQRIGIYLDHSAGILSFYAVSKTTILLYRVQSTFTQPLYAGLGIHHYDLNPATAEFCKLR